MTSEIERLKQNHMWQVLTMGWLDGVEIETAILIDYIGPDGCLDELANMLDKHGIKYEIVKVLYQFDVE